MVEMTECYNQIFPPMTVEQEANYAEGIENCVMKNLKDELIDFKQEVPAHSEERKENQRIARNIEIFGSLIEPRHLEIESDRLIDERIK